ncbi:MAG TPA: response regulator transcription factor [Chloroflexi bacterium]|nr:response regulator transcription factor [Chloroflexota bacterium]
MSAKLLLIDDSEEIQALVGLFLEKEGYQVIRARNGREGLRKLAHERPDLILLDIMMPEVDGWETCRQVREISNVPIIMLTAKGQERDIVRGLEMGADDYVTKPFDLAELRARIRALLRRATEMSPEDSQPKLFDDGYLRVDLERRLVTVEGKGVDLTPTEYRLLAALVQQAGRVIPHRQLLKQVWGPEYGDEVHYLKLYVRYLRQKLEKDPSHPYYILTEWGVGYRFRDFPGRD